MSNSDTAIRDRNYPALGGFLVAVVGVTVYRYPIAWTVGRFLSINGIVDARRIEGRPRYRLAVVGLVLSVGSFVVWLARVSSYGDQLPSGSCSNSFGPQLLTKPESAGGGVGLVGG